MRNLDSRIVKIQKIMGVRNLIMEASKKDVLVNQVGWGGVYLGRIDIDVESGFFQAEKICVD
jgi:hypothetical protein